jgi:hypothetical protein
MYLWKVPIRAADCYHGTIRGRKIIFDEHFGWIQVNKIILKE